MPSAASPTRASQSGMEVTVQPQTWPGPHAGTPGVGYLHRDHQSGIFPTPSKSNTHHSVLLANNALAPASGLCPGLQMKTRETSLCLSKDVAKASAVALEDYTVRYRGQWPRSHPRPSKLDHRPDDQPQGAGHVFGQPELSPQLGINTRPGLPQLAVEQFVQAGLENTQFRRAVAYHMVKGHADMRRAPTVSQQGQSSERASPASRWTYRRLPLARQGAVSSEGAPSLQVAPNGAGETLIRAVNQVYIHPRLV